MLRRRLIAILIAAVWVTFAPAVGFSFLNWDDNLVIVENAALAQPGVARWAFTTTYMEHYQPLSWLVWAAPPRQRRPDSVGLPCAPTSCCTAPPCCWSGSSRTPCSPPDSGDSP